MREERKNNFSNKEVERGHYAWECVDEAEKLAKEEHDFEVKKEDYKSYAKKFPIMILTNGFSHAMAFAFSKGFKIEKKNEENREKIIYKVKTWGLLFYHIVRWLNKNGSINHINPQDIYSYCMEFMEDMLNKSAENYKFYEEEALRVLNWIRRIADGRIGGGE